MRGTTVNGDLIRDLRKAQGWTQEQLAEQAGLDVKTVRSAEQSKRLDLGSLTKLCLVLPSELRKLTVRPSRSARDREIHRRDAVIDWQRAFNNRDLDGLLRCYHEEAALHMPGAPVIPFGGDYRGHKSLRRMAQIAWDCCQTDLGVQQEYAILASRDTVVVQGRQRVQLPDGSLSQLHYTQTFQFAGELIVDHRVDYDTLNFARLAKIPLAESPAETQTLGSSRKSTTSR